MTELTRFSVSIDKSLLSKFDRQLDADKYPTRSKAVADLIRNRLIEKQWTSCKKTAGAAILVYDHHRRGLANKLIHIQHEYHSLIVSTQHVHLDHDNCLEVIVLNGLPGKMEKLALELKSTKGVKHCSLTMATTGKGL